MIKAWQDLVLKWLNCLGAEPLKTIQEVKNRNFLEILAVTPSLSIRNASSFEQLLSYLHSFYPRFGNNLSEPNHVCWEEDSSLFLVSSLLLLHASIFHLSDDFQKRATQNLSATEQKNIVTFLEKAMSFEQSLTTQNLLDSIPSPPGNPSTPSPKLQRKQRRSQSTPLTDFLSSPVARHTRESNVRNQLLSVQEELEREQADKAELHLKVTELEAQMLDLGRKYKEKFKQAEDLQSSLRKVEEGQVAFNETQSRFHVEKRRLQQELSDSEKYVKKLQDEMAELRTEHSTLQEQLLLSQENSSELKVIVQASKDQVAQLKHQVKQHTEENILLRSRCTQLERDLNQIHSSTYLSPRRPDKSSFASPSSSPAPESMGFILEKQLIDREDENKLLQKNLNDLKDELRTLKANFKKVEDKAEKDKESAFRAQKRLESDLSTCKSNLDSTYLELSSCKREKDELNSELSESLRENKKLNTQLEELVTKKDALLATKKALCDSKNSLEKKVAQLEAKLSIAAEREEELHDIGKKREQEWIAIKQKLDDMEINELKLAKERDLMEEQLTEARNKLALAKNVEFDKIALEEQAIHLKQTVVELEKTSATFDLAKRTLEEKLHTLIAEKNVLDDNIKDLMSENNELTASLRQMNEEKGSVRNEYIALVKDKVHWEAELTEVQRQVKEAKEEARKEEIEKKNFKDKVAELLATNESLTAKLSISVQQESDNNSKLAEIVKQRKAVENQLSTVMKEKEKLETALQESSSQLAQISRERESLNYRLRNKTEECENISLNFQDLLAKKTGVEAQLADEEAKSNRLQGQISHLKELFEASQLEVSKVKDDLNELLQECQEKSAAITDLEAEKTDIEDDLCHYVSSLNTVQQENVSLKRELVSLKNEKENLSLEKESLQQLQSELEEKCSQMQVDLLSTRKELEDLSPKLVELAKDKDELHLQLRNRKDLIVNLETNLENLKKTNLLLENQVSSQSAHIEELQKKLKAITQDFSGRNTALQEECDEKSQQLSILKGDLGEMQLKYEYLLQEKNKFSIDLEGLTKKNEALEEEVANTISQLEALMQEREEISKQLQQAKEEKENALRKVSSQNSEIESKFIPMQMELTSKVKALEDEIELSHSKYKKLLYEAGDEKSTLSIQIQEMQKSVDLKEILLTKLQKNVDQLKGESESLQEKFTERVGALQDEVESAHQNQKEYRERVKEEKEALLNQIYELQGSIDVKEELLSEAHKCVEKLRGEREALQELVKVKDKIITCQNATASSLERQSSDEMEVAMKLLEGELLSSRSISEVMAQELMKIQENYEEEKVKLQKALEEAQSSAKNYQQEAVELKQQLSAPKAPGKMAELQQEEKVWQMNRAKIQVEFQFDSMIKQKIDLEDHLDQLRDILKDVTCICDNLFASLPPNCNAVHEVTVMRKEVETKLRAVDKKYADSLCSIISLADEMFKWTKMHTNLSMKNGEVEGFETSADKENIDLKASKCCEAMTSLSADVRSVINSCKFLIERCESYLKAQTRESLKIKTCLIKEDVGALNENQPQNDHPGENHVVSTGETSPQPIAVDLTSENKTCAQIKTCWFGDSASMEEGYKLMKSSYEELEKQVSDLHCQLKELQSQVSQESHFDLEQRDAKLQDQIKTLSLRPTREQLDEKLTELHSQYSKKLESMKSKMKQIVKEEVDKVEEQKANLEKEIVAKYSKRIAEFEEHVQELSAQQWELCDKLLQEQEDHKVTKERFDALKERQRQYLMSKQRTQSLDRLDIMLQGTKSVQTTQMKRRCNSQTAQSGLASAKVHPIHDISTDVVDESTSRRSTMMAPASMGLAFPEEDEDGEVFNNDYLAELKEGRCRVPLDGSRVSELQYRNSLCPPHLKSSYPVETQFHDPQAVKDEDLKGLDSRIKRQGKDKGTTSYQKPGPPTPSRKGGRLSLQGKEDLTPKVATLRDHNESQSSAIGILRANKSTPSRLKALFTSSKVANAATLPASKKDENSTPATPTSKRLSIFKRRFGINKENQATSSHYASFR